MNKNPLKDILKLTLCLALFIVMAFVLVWGLITVNSVFDCVYYNEEGYVTSLHWESITLECDVALEYNNGEITFVDSDTIGDTFVIENYGVRK